MLQKGKLARKDLDFCDITPRSGIIYYSIEKWECVET